jgi:hypothetical protein
VRSTTAPREATIPLAAAQVMLKVVAPDWAIELVTKLIIPIDTKTDFIFFWSFCGIIVHYT